MKLTPEQVTEIAAELHERVQFYDEMGNRANTAVVAEIEAQLTAAFIDEPSVEEARQDERAGR